MILISGCGSLSYIRSDVFANADSIKNIHVMPIVSEATIDAKFHIIREELQKQIRNSLQSITETIALELTERGYGVSTHNKLFKELNLNQPQEKLLHEAVLEFIKPDENSGFNLKPEEKDGMTFSLVNNFSPESHSPLVEKTAACKESIPADTDTVLFLSVKSHIAKRSFFGSVTEKSYVRLELGLINFKENEMIFLYERTYTQVDLFTTKKLREAVNDIIQNIPVKL